MIRRSVEAHSKLKHPVKSQLTARSSLRRLLESAALSHHFAVTGLPEEEFESVLWAVKILCLKGTPPHNPRSYVEDEEIVLPEDRSYFVSFHTEGPRRNHPNTGGPEYVIDRVVKIGHGENGPSPDLLDDLLDYLCDDSARQQWEDEDERISYDHYRMGG